MKKALAILTIVAVLGSVGVAGAERRDGRRNDGRPGYCGWGDRWREWREGNGSPDEWRRPGMRREGAWDHWGDRRDREDWRHHDRVGRDGGMRRWWRELRKDASGEIRSKVVELEKLRIDMRDALTRDPIDREKALEVFEKMAALRREIAGWAFNRKLDALERRQKEAGGKIGVPSPAVSGDVAPKTSL